MARIAFEKIMAGLDDALAFADGDSSRGTAHQIKVADVDITHLREKLGLSQDRFAARKKKAEGCVRVLLIFKEIGE